MTPYFFFFILCLFAALSPSFVKDKKIRLFILFILGVFLCTGYMTGSDWRAYELLYEKMSTLNDVQGFEKEKGFAFLFYVFSRLGIDFWVLWIAIKIVCFCVTIKTLYHFSKDAFGWALFFFYGYFALFYYIDNPMRNLIASTIFIYSYRFILNKKLLKYLLACLLAALFHMSVIFAIPLYFICNKMKVISLRTTIISITVIFTLLSILWSSGLAQTLSLVLDLYLGEDFRGSGYLEDDSYGLSLGMVFIILLYLFARIKCKKKNGEYSIIDRFILNTSFLMIITLSFGMVTPIMFRISMYFFAPFLVLIGKCLSTDIKKLDVVFVRVLTIVFLLFVLKGNITGSYKYVPYTSYLTYIFSDKPSYDYRDNFNYQYSPYSK